MIDSLIQIIIAASIGTILGLAAWLIPKYTLKDKESSK